MRKTNLLKIILLITLMVVFLSNAVYASGFSDLDPTVDPEDTNTNTTTDTEPEPDATESNTSNSLISNSTTTNNTTSSVYNNTNLPDTGLEDSLPVVALAIIFGISAVFAFRKVKEYKNI